MLEPFLPFYVASFGAFKAGAVAVPLFIFSHIGDVG